jgi:hypothetical protein
MKNHNNKYTEIKNKKQSWWPYKKSIFQKKTNHKPQFLYNPILNDEIKNKKNNNKKKNLDQSKLAYKTCNLSSKTIIIPWKENQKTYNAKFPTIQI